MVLVIVQITVRADHFPALPSVLIAARVQTAWGRVVAEVVNLLCLAVFGYTEEPCQRN
jgi:hypothetical protein